MIVGGGLSSLVVAYEFLVHSLGSVLILEAASKLGGRLQMTDEGIDMGAAWVWENDNPLVMQLLKTLSLKTMLQPGTHPGMKQNRVVGGAALMAHRLSDIIKSKDDGNIKIESQVTKVSLDEKTGHIVTTIKDGTEYISKHVVIGTPPRIAKKINFTPELSAGKRKAADNTPAWMSKVGKIVLKYDDKWWDDYEAFGSLPADGPGFQMYDASMTSANALVLFCQSPPAVNEDGLKKLIIQQLTSSFGSKASTPSDISLTIWARNPFINENPNDFKMFHLPPNKDLSTPEWNSKLLFAGAEAARRHPGYIEGALESAYAVMNDLHSQCSAN